MVHHSRVAAIGIDVPVHQQHQAAAFWAGALGRAVVATGDGVYIGVGKARGLDVFVQQIEGPARVHLDIETDDIEAEVGRREVLGAQRVARVGTWWIMRDPARNPFCVVRPQSDDFPDAATTWP